MSYKYGHQLQSRIADATGRGFSVVPLTSGVQTWTYQTTVYDQPQTGFQVLYRGGICVANGSRTRGGGDATLGAGIGPAVGYI